MSNGRTTNTEIFDLLIKLSERTSKIEGKLEHTATEEQVGRIEERLEAIEKLRPAYDRAADRTDVAKGREMERDKSSKETRSVWALMISSIAAAVAVVTAWWEGVK